MYYNVLVYSIPASSQQQIQFYENNPGIMLKLCQAASTSARTFTYVSTSILPLGTCVVVPWGDTQRVGLITGETDTSTVNSLQQQHVTIKTVTQQLPVA